MVQIEATRKFFCIFTLILSLIVVLCSLAAQGAVEDDRQLISVR